MLDRRNVLNVEKSKMLINLAVIGLLLFGAAGPGRYHGYAACSARAPQRA